MNREFFKNNREGGFIKFIALFLIFAGLLVYFGIDVRGFMENHPKILNFSHDVGVFAVGIWFHYILPLLQWIWNQVDSFVLPFFQWMGQMFEM